MNTQIPTSINSKKSYISGLLKRVLHIFHFDKDLLKALTQHESQLIFLLMSFSASSQRNELLFALRQVVCQSKDLQNI